MNKRFLTSTAAVTVAAAALALSFPLAASAHVRVNPDQAQAGSYATLTFKVPTESATAGTVKLEVDLPTENPFSSVSYQPLAGWKTDVVTEKLAKPIKTDDGTVTEAPVKVIWTADSGVQIAPGQFQQFVISAGAVPNTGSVLLPAHQTYSDGSVVDWDQKTPADGKEPEHPAPTLYINDAPPSSAGGSTASVTSAPVADTTATSSSASDTVALWLGIGGLALGAIALVIAVLALTRRAQPTQTRN